MEVTESRSSLEADNERLMSAELQLTADLHALQQRLDSAESLNEEQEAKIIEQQRDIDTLVIQCRQVNGLYSTDTYSDQLSCMITGYSKYYKVTLN